MKTISRRRVIRKWYRSLRLAERYQNGLCQRYNEVRLIYFPSFDEDGLYIWEVR